MSGPLDKQAPALMYLPEEYGGQLGKQVTVNRNAGLASLHDANFLAKEAGQPQPYPTSVEREYDIREPSRKLIANDTNFTMSNPSYATPTTDRGMKGLYDAHAAAVSAAPDDREAALTQPWSLRGKIQGPTRAPEQVKRQIIDTPNEGESGHPLMGAVRAGGYSRVIASINMEQHGVKYDGSQADYDHFSSLSSNMGHHGGLYKISPRSANQSKIRAASLVNDDCIESVNMTDAGTFYMPSKKSGC